MLNSTTHSTDCQVQQYQQDVIMKKNKKEKKSLFSRFKNVFKSDKNLKKTLKAESENFKKDSYYYNCSIGDFKHTRRDTTSSLNEDTEDEHNEEDTLHGSENGHHTRDELHFHIMNDPESTSSPPRSYSPSSISNEYTRDVVEKAAKYLESDINSKMNIIEPSRRKTRSPNAMMILEETSEKDVLAEEIMEEEAVLEEKDENEENMACVGNELKEEGSVIRQPSKPSKKVPMKNIVAAKTKQKRKTFEFTKDGKPMVFGYVAGKILGTGMSGKVKLGHHIDDENNQVALKIITKNKKSPLMLRLLETELKVMQRINSHPHILKLLDSEKDVPYQETINSEIDYSICMALEVASNGELFDYILHTDVFSEILARTYAYQLTSAISYCHEHGVIHRDIKPENLLLDSNFQLKVADFGLSSDKTKFQEYLSTECGTKAYMAPEVLSKSRYIGEKSDCWSIGVVLFIMLSGNPPFQIADTNDWWFKQLATNRPERFWKAHLSYYPSFPRQAMTVIGRMFQPNPKYRTTVTEIKQDMWMNLQKLNDEELYNEMRGRKLKVENQKLKERKSALESKQALQNAAASFCKTVGTTTNNVVVDPFEVKVTRTIQPETSNEVLDRATVLPPIFMEPEEELFTNSSFYQIYTGSDGFKVVDKVLSLIMTHKLFRPLSMLQKKDTFSYLIKGANVEFTFKVHRVKTESEKNASSENHLSDYVTMVRLDRIQGDKFSFGLMFKLIHHTLSSSKVNFNSEIIVIQDEQTAQESFIGENLADTTESILDEKTDIF